MSRSAWLIVMLVMLLIVSKSATALMLNWPVPPPKPPTRILSFDPIPAELARRNELRLKVMKPQVKSWAEAEAKMEEKRPRFELIELEAAIRNHILPSFPPPGASQTGTKPGTAQIGVKRIVVNPQLNNAVAEMTLVVILRMVNDGELELTAQMKQAQEQIDTKAALRDQVIKLEQQVAFAEQQVAIALRTAPTSERSGVCHLYICTKVPGQVTEINAKLKKLKTDNFKKFPAQLKYSGVIEQQGRVQLDQDGGLPQEQMNALRTELDRLADDLDSDNEVTEMGALKVKVLMDARQKLLDTASEIEKTESDTDAAIVGNIKQ